MIGQILVFSRSTPHHRAGGMETQSWSLAAQWARLGADVTVVTTAIPGTRDGFRDEGVAVVPLAQTEPGSYSRSWWEASSGYWQALSTAPEVVLSVSAGAFSLVRKRSTHPRTPFVMQAHGTAVMDLQSKLSSPRSLVTAPKSVLALAKDLALYREFDQIVAVGERVRDSLTGKLLSRAVEPRRVRLIPNGVAQHDYGFDPLARKEIRASLGLPENVVVVGSVGRLHPQKRLDRVLRAAAVLRDRGLAERFRFLVVGEGPDAQRLHRLAQRLRLEHTVLFPGPVSRAAVRDYHSASDLSLLTTAWREGLPMSVLEALACGLPCVVTAGSVAAKGLSGLLHEVDTADSQALAAALEEASSTVRERVSMLPRDFQLEQSAREYLRLFGELRSAREAERLS